MPTRFFFLKFAASIAYGETKRRLDHRSAMPESLLTDTF